MLPSKCYVHDYVIDLGASFYVTSCGKIFTSYTSGAFGYVQMGNRSVSKVIDIGNICLETNNG